MSIETPIRIASTRLHDDELAAAARVLRSGRFRQGAETKAFEKDFGALVGAEYAVACANGSAALHLAYYALLTRGDEVLVPAFTFIGTASMVVAAGGVPVFCDVDRETFLLDLEDARRRITPRTRAIAPVHLFGNPMNVELVRAFAEEFDLRVIWDAAQAHAAKVGDVDVGGLGDVVTYSFYPTKNLFVGEGGMICTPDPALAERFRLLRSHGASTKYEHTEIGFNYRMTDVEAAIGLAQLKRFPDMVARRAANARRLDDALAQVAGLARQRITSHGTHAWHQYVVVLDSQSARSARDELRDGLTKLNVETAVHYPRGLHRQQAFAGLGANSGAFFPNTDWLSERVLSLPVHHDLREEEIERVGDAVTRVMGALHPDN